MPIQTTKKWFLKYSAIWGYIVTALGSFESALGAIAPDNPKVGAIIFVVGVVQVAAAAVNQHIDEHRAKSKLP